LKIAGVVNNYKEALAIEDIVRTFIIEQKILNLSSLEKKKNFKNGTEQNIIIFPTNDNQFSETSNTKNLHIKNDEDSKPVFNVRGLI
jgi:hypothetical protein